MMNMKIYICSILLALVLSATLARGLCGAQTTRKPNVVIILADDLGYGDVGAYGSKIVPTPHIDRLARAGVRFTKGYVTASICSPSRAALMTGRYQARFGHDFNPTMRDPQIASLPAAEKTIAERMRAAGYRTGLIGKWHLGLEGAYHPLARGFAEFWGYQSEAAFIQREQPGDEKVPLPTLNIERRNRYFRGREPLEDDGYLTEVTTREALSFIDRNKAQPFFLLVTHHAPHVPLEATKQYLDRVKHISDKGQRVYAAMVAALDDGVGAIVSKLDELKLAQDTLVVFLSDNGCASYVNGACTNAPLNGFKRDQLEGGIRVPMIARWPGQLKAGVDYAAPVISLDLMATALALGSADLKSAPLDGVDLMPYLTGKAQGAPHQYLFWRAERITLCARVIGSCGQHKRRAAAARPFFSI
jgi:arylsulfatase A-like enzyme